MKRLALFVSLGMLASLNSALAGMINPAVFAGTNRTTYSFSNESPSGFGFTAGALVSFFSSWPVGLRLALIDNYRRARAGALKVAGNVPQAAATLTVNYEVPQAGRISLGFGAAIESQSGMSCTGIAACPSFNSSVGGIVLDAKFDGQEGLIGFAQGFFPTDESRNTWKMGQVLVGLGFEWGASKKR